MRRWFSLVLVAAAVLGFGVLGAAPANAAAMLGRVGETLRVDNNTVIADITVMAPVLSEIPPGFGYPPRSPRQQVWKSQVVIQAKQVPNPYYMGIRYWFRGVTPTADAYEPRNSDAPDALQFGLQNAPQGSTITGWVYWDCYRDLVSNIVLVDKKTGIRLAQWNV